jgi:integrase
MSPTPAKLRRIASEYDASAAQLRSAAELLDRATRTPTSPASSVRSSSAFPRFPTTERTDPMAADKAPRRAPGTGTLYTRTDSAGRETWYAKWGTAPNQVKRAIGPKRTPGTRDGLTRAQAEKKLRDLMGEEQPRKTTVGERLTIAEVGRRYRVHLERLGRKRTTLTAVESTLRVHLEPFFGTKGLDAIRYEDVVDLVTLLEARGLKPKSIHNYVGTLSALFNYAKAPRRRWASGNPCDGVELPGIPESDEIRFLDEAEWEAVLRNVVKGPYSAIDRAFYLTAVMAGLRHGELCALRWRDVDWTAGRIRVRQNWVLGDFDTPKSRRGSRSVPMADRLAGELDRLYTALGQPGDDALVFADPTSGDPLDKAADLRRYRKVLKAAGLDLTHNLHGLRHTFGTRMAAAGVPMRTLQEWMGHRDISTTERYADYAPSQHESDLIERAWAPGTRRATGAADLAADASQIP